MAIVIVRSDLRYEAQIAHFIEYKERKKMCLIFEHGKDDFISRDGRRIRLPKRVLVSNHSLAELAEFFIKRSVRRREWVMLSPRIISKDEACFYRGMR